MKTCNVEIWAPVLLSRHPSILSDNGKRHGFGHQFCLEQRLAWLPSPILEWQSLSQVVQREVGGWLESRDSWRSFLRCLLSSSSLFCLSSPILTPFRTALRHALRSSAICSQLPGSMSASLRSRLQTSLKRSAGWPAGRCPVASSPYSISFGMRPSPMRCTWPSQRSLCWQRRRCMLWESARPSTAVLVTLSCQVMPRMRRKQRRWKLSRRFSCLA